jgi:uncharacterized phage-like protein YoqJ
MRVMITGHRPIRVGGYRTPNPTEQWVRAHLRVILERLLVRHPSLVAISGMALGTDLIFAEEAHKLGIPFVAATPFEGQESRWPAASQAHYREIMAQAREVVRVDEVEGYKASSLKAQFLSRNKWMVEHSDMTIAVWDGSPGGTSHAVKTAWGQGRSVLCLDPARRAVTTKRPTA